jgi:hypothetical protein
MNLPKIELPNVTLTCIDNIHHKEAIAAMERCSEHINFGDVVPLFLLPINSIEEYSKFVFKGLADYIQTDFCMIVQHDGFVLNPYLWQDAFLDYDYIGAPWWYQDGHNVGNGGFSIRSRRLMLELLEPFYDDVHPEDDRICRKYRKRLESKGFTFAPEWLAKQFSWEGNPTYPEFKNDTFGYHCNGFKLPKDGS